MTLKRRRLSKRNHDIDPMSSAVNMTDVMLVLAVGFLIIAVMATGAQNIINSDMSPQEKQSAMQAAQQTTELDEETTPLDTKPEEIQSSGSGYQEKGKVYQDPSTGKLVLVKSS